jgi:Uma2 family endonuclease
MNAIIRPDEIEPVIVPMTVEALRILDEQGFFANDNHRHELIDGVLIMVPPPGLSHQRSERRTNKNLVEAISRAGLGATLSVQPGGGFIVNEHSHLGPDFMVVRETDDLKEWTASDVIVVIEVAWSSLTIDLGDKARLYASAGIADYWVLDVADKALIVHRDPSATHYGAVTTLRAPERVSALLEPALSVAVADLF